MSTRMRIAFATCPPQAPVIQRLAPRFAAIADIQAYPCGANEAEAVLPALRDAAPHVVVTEPASMKYLTDHLRTSVILFDLTTDALAARVDEALQEAGSIAAVLMAGTVTPPLARFLKRTADGVDVLTWNSHAHLRDLIARCRRKGIQAIIGGETAASLAGQEGMQGLCLYDRPDETDGAISQMIATAAAHCAPQFMGRPEDLAAFGLILEKIGQGAIGPHDTVLCTDTRGLVTTVHAHPCEGLEASRPSPAIPTGVPLLQALRVPACGLEVWAGRGDRPIQVDLYPILEAGSNGYVAVVRGEPREDDTRGDDWGRQLWGRQ